MFQVERHVSDAKEHGAKVVCGGKISELGGSFYEPTVLADATNDMSVSQEETFGPVAPVIRYVDSFFRETKVRILVILYNQAEILS